MSAAASAPQGSLSRRSLLGRLTSALLLGASALVSVASAQDVDGARPEGGEDLLAIVGGEVHTGRGVTFPRGVVLIRGSRIHAVGADLPIPEGARIIDATGRWVLPGFVAPRGDDFGIRRGTPGLGERYADNLDPTSTYAELALAAGITAYYAEGPRRGIYGFTNAVVKPAYGAPELMIVKEPAALELGWAQSAGAERAAFETVLVRMRAWIDGGRKGRAPAHDVVAQALERKIPTRVVARRRAEIRGVLELAARHDLKLVVEDAHEAWTLPEDFAASGATAIVVPRARFWPTTGRERSTGSDIMCAGILEKAGVPFCVLPPGGFGGRGHGITLGGVTGRDMLTYPLDGGFAVRGGASGDAALRAITLTAAEALGVADRLGSLEAGKDADVVIYQGDPFDHRFMAEVTIVSGRVLYERSKSALFSHLPDPRTGVVEGADSAEGAKPDKPTAPRRED